MIEGAAVATKGVGAVENGLYSLRDPVLHAVSALVSVIPKKVLREKFAVIQVLSAWATDR